MKIAVVSNIYPPLFIGGYEIGASQIVEELKKQGHDVIVLSAHEYSIVRGNQREHWRHSASARGELVDVGLCIFGDPRYVGLKDKCSLGVAAARTILTRWRCMRALRRFKPEAILLFNPFGIYAPLLYDIGTFSKANGSVVGAYVSDGWLSQWPAANLPVRAVAWLRKSGSVKRRALGRFLESCALACGVSLPFVPLIDNYFYCSDFIRRISRRNAIAVAQHAVVHWGVVEPDSWPTVPIERYQKTSPLRLVFAGQIARHKGLDVLLRALALTKRSHTLLVIGDDRAHAPDYGMLCNRLVNQLNLSERVRFTGKLSPQAAREAMHSTGEVLILPSMWEEPFSIVVLEGMACGMPVVASATGGTPELIKDGWNGFLHHAGDHGELARHIDRLEADRSLSIQLGITARQNVVENHSIRKMTTRIVSMLQKTRLLDATRDPDARGRFARPQAA